VITDNERARQRENPEPEEGMRKTPMIVLLWIAVLIVWGVGYYAYNIGKPLLGGDSRTAPEVNVSSAGGEGGSGINGKTVFNAQCAACHQANGQGVPGTFPPLAGSKWVVAARNIPIAIVHDGLQGEIEVGGQTYNGMMPAFKGTLSNDEIAAVLSYIRQEWGNQAEPITGAQVEEHQAGVGERGPWSADELKETYQAP
jgi:mono/diheme cytochrome c family protein